MSLSTAAFAQEQTEVITVTGSRIPQANANSVSAVQAVPKAEFELKGATDVIDLLNDLPQNFQNAGADFSNTTNPLTTPGGITTADLRGIGPQRTLVLVNGRRLGVGDPTTANPNPAPDLDQIPVALVDRVEVLTGGASATYGSDAVAGVVNFIMKSDFEGLRADAQIGADWHSNNNDRAQSFLRAKHFKVPAKEVVDGQNVEFSLAVGTNTANGKGNVTAYFVYRNARPVSEGNRDFSACKLNIGATTVCSGSPNSNYFQGIVPFTTPIYAVVGHQLIDQSTNPNANPPLLFNSNPYQYLSRQDTRYNAGFYAHYDAADWAKVYGEFTFMNDRSQTQIAPSGLFAGSGVAPDGSGANLVNCDNPLLSAQQVNILCTSQGLGPTDNAELLIGRRNLEGGGRGSYYEHNNFRGVVGVKGDFLSAWHYDVYGSTYYTEVYQSNLNYFSLSRAARALQVVNVGGVPTCTSVVNGSDTNCIPYNIWTEGGVTPAQVNYLNELGTSRGSMEEQIVEANVDGDLGHYGIKSPYADEGVKIAAGVSYRRDAMKFRPDEAEQSNDLSGFGGAAVPIDRSIAVTEGFGEIRIPLAQSQPLVEDLTFEGGYRYSEYSTGSHPSTYKLGLIWSPASDVRFRGAYQVAIRAPNILEAYTPQSVTNTSDVSVDPCAPVGSTPATATLAQCMHTGVTAAQYGNGGTTSQIVQCPSGQCSTLTGGNPDLDPETAKTITVGLTFTPTFIDGLIASIDYYDIKLTNVVGSVPLATSMQECLNSGTPIFCANIRRTAQGFLFGNTVNGGGYVVGASANVAAGEYEGIDLQADYAMNLERLWLDGYGSLSFHMVGTYTLKIDTQVLPTEPVYDCTGLFGATCGTVNPTWRHQLRVSWQTPWDVLISPQWRFIDGTALDTNSPQPGLGNGAFDSHNAHMAAISYFDLAVTWQATPNISLRVGMNNILDRDPPIVSSLIAGTGSPNAYPTYDLLGRTMFLAVTGTL
jgi:iron complex outermembrane recepter protein